MSVKEETTSDLGGSTRAAETGRGASWRRAIWILQVAQVRLRFLFVLAAAFLIVGNWHVLRNYWDAWTAPARSGALQGVISADTEFFCPMCPGVISDWPTHCSVCNMPLVRRRKGDAVQLPEGVLARMQLSPYRVQLAGIRTSRVDYQPLVRQVVVSGSVERLAGDEAQASDEAREAKLAVILAEIAEQEIPFVALGAAATLASDAFPGRKPWQGEVTFVAREVSADTRRVKIRLSASDPDGELWPGMRVQVRIERPLAELEPFRSQPADPPALSDGELRKLFFCPEHPHVVREKAGRCPEDKNPLAERVLNDLQRIDWWCPMHPEVNASEPGHECAECNGMKLLPRIVNYRPAGQVLAVPESAILDSGHRRIAYVERMPGLFDALEVVVGPRCDGFYPVIRGLAPGDRVATAGAFLIDAETRLNPSIAAAYFGAVRNDSDSDATVPATSSESGDDAEAEEIRAALAKLSAQDRSAAERQKLCPVTGMALGSMGTPIRVKAGERTVWLCCEGCEGAFAKQPKKYLDKFAAPAEAKPQ